MLRQTSFLLLVLFAFGCPAEDGDLDGGLSDAQIDGGLSDAQIDGDAEDGASPVDAGISDSALDSSPLDAAVVDGGASEDAGADADTRDGAVMDAGSDASMDAGSDAGATDAGMADGGSTDGGTTDASTSDSGTTDSGAMDSGTDASIDSGSDASMDSGTDAAIDAPTDAPSDTAIARGDCISGAEGTHAVRFYWRGSGSGSRAWVDYDVNELPDTSRWRAGAFSRGSVGYTPVFTDPFLGDGGLQMSGTVFMDLELSTAGLSSIRNVTIALLGRSFNTTSPGAYSWMSFDGAGATPRGFVSNSAPYEWYPANATTAFRPGNAGVLLRISPEGPSNSLVVHAVELCFDAS